MNQIVKSRDISIVEYLECLISEYFQADMRAHVYRKRSDKSYWSRTASHKQEKILDITSRNRIPNIFDEQSVYEKYYNKYYSTTELPTIFENDKDIQMYYSEGSDVTVHDADKILVGKILTVDLINSNVEVNLFDDNSVHTYTFAQVRRIL